MSRSARILGVLLFAVAFCSQTGCAYFTARKVATMAGKHVAKQVVKKGMEKSKDDKAKSDKAKKEQELRERAKRDHAKNQEMQSTNQPASR